MTASLQVGLMLLDKGWMTKTSCLIQTTEVEATFCSMKQKLALIKSSVL